MKQETATVDARGAFVVPAKIRERLGIGAGTLLLLEVSDGCLTARPAVAVPVERYTRERRAEFLLNNAVDDADYQRALDEVRKLGLEPDAIPHERPGAA